MNYISDNENDGLDDTVTKPNTPVLRSSERIRKMKNRTQSLNIIMEIAPLKINTAPRYTRGLTQANQYLQIKEWAWEENFAGAVLNDKEKYFSGSVINEDTSNSLEYRALIKHPKYQDIWHRSYANELGRISQSFWDIKDTDNIRFIKKNKLPQNQWRDATYGHIVVDYRPQKFEPHQTILTVGGEKINYPYDISTPTADLATIKLLWNSTISTPGAKFFTIDVNNFYLVKPMERPE